MNYSYPFYLKSSFIPKPITSISFLQNGSFKSTDSVGNPHNYQPKTYIYNYSLFQIEKIVYTDMSLINVGNFL